MKENRKFNVLEGLIPLVIGILGALSGANDSSKIFRRYLIPVIDICLFFYVTDSMLAFTVLTLAVPLSLGYGLPSYDDPKPSGIGAFWFPIVKGNMLFANILTRGTIGLLECLCLLAIPILTKDWKSYSIGCIIILVANCVISWQDLGSYKLFNRNLLWSETILYGMLEIGILIMLFWRIK